MSSQLTSADQLSLTSLEPSMIDLPGMNWICFKPTDKSLIAVEMEIVNSIFPRPRKHVQVDVETGLCTSYILERKISDVQVTDRCDVARCIEEIHVMQICVGGFPASNDVETVSSNARIDPMGNWRHNSCKIVARYSGLPCIACSSINSITRTSSSDMKKVDFDEASKDLSHRQQNQILALYKRRLSWEKQRLKAERKLADFKNMIKDIYTSHKRPRTDTDDDEI